MSAIEQLIRLHRWKLDEKRRRGADLERLADRFRRDMEQLKAELRREQEAAASSIELQRSLPGYASAIRNRCARLETSAREVESELEEVREEIAEAYREMKRYEQALSSREARRQAVLRRREQIASDEIGLSIYRRRQ
ncbi:flagellar FliJ family protein [Rhodospirillaceae bacterium SYSU D60014]|uniref:flagellar FliJ family protein n=1 Tax=Virgifigura deserti TaxID=2268457 RepID=UPI000E66FA0E